MDENPIESALLDGLTNFNAAAGGAASSGGCAEVGLLDLLNLSRIADFDYLWWNFCFWKGWGRDP